MPFNGFLELKLAFKTANSKFTTNCFLSHCSERKFVLTLICYKWLLSASLDLLLVSWGAAVLGSMLVRLRSLHVAGGAALTLAKWNNVGSALF